MAQAESDVAAAARASASIFTVRPSVRIGATHFQKDLLSTLTIAVSLHTQVPGCFKAVDSFHFSSAPPVAGQALCSAALDGC